jgi:hypothetical protein
MFLRVKLWDRVTAPDAIMWTCEYCFLIQPSSVDLLPDTAGQLSSVLVMLPGRRKQTPITIQVVSDDEHLQFLNALFLYFIYVLDSMYVHCADRIRSLMDM